MSNISRSTVFMPFFDRICDQSRAITFRFIDNDGQIVCGSCCHLLALQSKLIVVHAIVDMMLTINNYEIGHCPMRKKCQLREFVNLLSPSIIRSYNGDIKAQN